MITVAEFAVHLERSLALVRPEIERGLVKLGEVVAPLAKSYIGHEHAEWAPLKAETIEDKARHGFATPDPLLRTGHMRDSIKAKVDVLDYTLMVGSDDDKALWHEMGTKHFKPRPFLSMAMLKSMPEADIIFGEVATRVLRGKP